MPGYIYHSKTIILIKDQITMRKHIHYDVEMIYVIEGNYRVITNNGTYDMKAGEIFIAFPFEEHAYERIGDNLTMIAIFPPETNERIKRCFFEYHPKKSFISVSEYPPLFGEMLRRIGELAMANGEYGVKNDKHIADEAYNKCPLPVSLINSYLNSAVEELISRLQLIPNAKRTKNTLAIILQYCSTHIFEKELSINSVAAAINVSKNYITAILKKKSGMNFTQLIHRLRIGNARYQLAYGADSCKEIAFNCGFSSQRAFNRVFLAEVGMTPLEFREAIVSGERKNNEDLGWE